MERACFTMRVAREHIPRYTYLHRHPWPELVTGLVETGWTNYSLFLRDDGYLVGYWESEDARASRHGLLPVSLAWSAEMDRLVMPGTELSPASFIRSSGPVGEGAGERSVVVLGGGRAFDSDGWERFAEFEAVSGERVVYGERGAGSSPAGSTFTEVFNLSRSARELADG